MGVLKLRDDDVECCKGGVGHDDRVDDETGHEHLFGPDDDFSQPSISVHQRDDLPLRTIPHGENELSTD